MSKTRFNNPIAGPANGNLVISSDSDIIFQTGPDGQYQGDIYIDQGCDLKFLGVPTLSGWYASLTCNVLSSNRTIILPDESGYLALEHNVPTSLTDLGISDGDDGDILFTDGAGNFSFRPLSLTLNDLADVETSGATVGQTLKWNGFYWVPQDDTGGTGGGSFDQSLNTTDDVTFNSITITAGTSGNLLTDSQLQDGTFDLNVNSLTISGTGIQTIQSGNDIVLDATNRVRVADTPFRLANLTTAERDAFAPAEGDMIYNTTTGKMEVYEALSWTSPVSSGSLETRTTAAHTTASLSDAGIETFSLTMAKSFSLMSIETSAASWVRLYVNSASRTADASRPQGQDPDPGSGVIAEIITTGSETIIISPATIGFNLENPVTTSIPCTITNLSGSTQAITVTTTYLKLEA